MDAQLTPPDALPEVPKPPERQPEDLPPNEMVIRGLFGPRRLRPGWYNLLVAWLSSWWIPKKMTVGEVYAERVVASLEQEVAALKTKVSALEDSLRLERQARSDDLLKHQREIDALLTERAFSERKLKAEVDASSAEVKLLTDVLERDRRRVEAETVIHLATIAHAEAGRRGG